MADSIFEGAATALITPMTEDGAVDYEAFGRLIDWQIEQGIDALLIAGTSGEGSTLSDEEHKEVLEFAFARAKGRVPMIAGTGSNHTDYAIALTKFACQVGYDAMLVVTPYYNKATQNGLVKMYEAIGKASTKPLIVYNVPSRTGVNIEPATYAKLMNVPHVKAIKEASGNISKALDTMCLTQGRLDMYSGNDDQIVPMLSIGAKGVISVLSNVFPKETHEMCMKYFRGDVRGALDDQLKYLPLIHALFSEVNPIPVKAAMAAMGFGANSLRLPLTAMEEEHKQVLFDEMRKMGALQ